MATDESKDPYSSEKSQRCSTAIGLRFLAGRGILRLLTTLVAQDDRRYDARLLGQRAFYLPLSIAMNRLFSDSARVGWAKTPSRSAV